MLVVLDTNGQGTTSSAHRKGAVQLERQGKGIETQRGRLNPMMLKLTLANTFIVAGHKGREITMSSRTMNNKR
jgi:hypothetical protein